eukprot:TRINITY_DN91673_c0_g1_i1.p1 TRINITY_DN91673_c0_g1~~TRINITY_DN91673_c0_g1_i1.p1  ORF type:complete len:102 (-),score=15.07 TRINITY_DN91673_c0_g1_i1:17-322(-)
MASTTFNATDAMEQTVKFDTEASGSEIEETDGGGGGDLQDAYYSLYEESYKLIERASLQKAKNSRLKNKIDQVKNEKDSLPVWMFTEYNIYRFKYCKNKIV